MSIFSRLRKRGPEDDGPSASSPEKQAPPLPGLAPPPAPPAPSPRPEVSRAPAQSAPPRGNVQAGVAGVIVPSAPVVAPKTAPPAPPPPRPPVEAPRAKPERAPVAPPPLATRVPVAVKEPAAGSLDLAIALALDEPLAATAGTSTASDEAALHATFEDLAVEHVAPVRSAMLEVRWGEAQASWLDIALPALKSLRRMASEVAHTTMVGALDGFLVAVQKVLEPGQPPALTGPSRDALLAAYVPLCACLPRAFEVDGERDRREPLVVRALLEQVAGLDPLMIDKMMAAGLGRLAPLYAARADEIAAVTAIPDDIAAATAARVQAFHRATPAALATVDPAATVRELADLVERLRVEHTAFEDAARGWSEADRLSKKRLRWVRQVSFLQITIALVRLGEIDVAVRLPKLAFARRLDELDAIVGRAAPVVRRADSGGSGSSGLQSGPHPVAA
jgi:hypothetical protein